MLAVLRGLFGKLLINESQVSDSLFNEILISSSILMGSLSYFQMKDEIRLMNNCGQFL